MKNKEKFIGFNCVLFDGNYQANGIYNQIMEGELNEFLQYSCRTIDTLEEYLTQLK